MSVRIPHRPLCQAALPTPISGLQRLATNFYWTWHPDARDVLREVDPAAALSGQHPLTTLLGSQRLDQLAADPDYVARVARAVRRMDDYLGEPWAARGRLTTDAPAAYFCAEYGLHESFGHYAGGLGILAGDHCKEASDMRLPFVAVGCYYHLGFFRQSLDDEGRQEHLYPPYPRAANPVSQVLRPGTDQPLIVPVPLPGRVLQVEVLLAEVGRVPLLLLDTDIEANSPSDRQITAQLYTRGREARFYQELVLGYAGSRALRELGVHPGVCHMNEGHSALLLIERLEAEIACGASLEQARRAVQSRSVLTIHTPVPEGNEMFDVKLVRRVLGPVLARAGVPLSYVLKAGLGASGDKSVFDMTAFGLRHSRDANGVSLLHGVTADKTWRKAAGLAVRGVTNGVHMPTWLGPEVRRVLESAGARFEPETGMGLESRGGLRMDWTGQVDKAALWSAHLAQKARTVEFVRDRSLAHHTKCGEGPDELAARVAAPNPVAFTIGFARRFATYKRAWLLFQDKRRLARLLNDPVRPVQLVFSGKAHPSDRAGQAVIAEVYQLAQDPKFRGKVFLVEDYDMEVGRMLVQGADLWLNNPRRPLEASGTSGMKAAANGVPNCSILDGWWDEAFEGGVRRNGFQVGDRRSFRSLTAQDRADGADLYRVLEDEVLPRFFDRGHDGLPHGWLDVMAQSVASSLHAFSTLRMLDDYVDLMY